MSAGNLNKLISTTKPDCLHLHSRFHGPKVTCTWEHETNIRSWTMTWFIFKVNRHQNVLIVKLGWLTGSFTWLSTCNHCSLVLSMKPGCTANRGAWYCKSSILPVGQWSALFFFSTQYWKRGFVIFWTVCVTEGNVSCERCACVEEEQTAVPHEARQSHLNSQISTYLKSSGLLRVCFSLILTARLRLSVNLSSHFLLWYFCSNSGDSHSRC